MSNTLTDWQTISNFKEITTEDNHTIWKNNILFKPKLDGTDSFVTLTSYNGTKTVNDGILTLTGGDCQFSTTFDNSVNWKFSCDFKTTGKQNRVGVSRLNYTRQNHVHMGVTGATTLNGYYGKSATGTGEYYIESIDFTSYLNEWVTFEITKTGTSVNFVFKYDGETITNDTRTIYWINQLSTLAVSACNWGSNTTYLKNIIVKEI